jgi:hypothetical protein
VTDLFECERLSAVLSRSSCAKRWRIATVGKRVRTIGCQAGARPSANDIFISCRGCPLGAGHARGSA